MDSFTFIFSTFFNLINLLFGEFNFYLFFICRRMLDFFLRLYVGLGLLVGENLIENFKLNYNNLALCLS